MHACTHTSYQSEWFCWGCISGGSSQLQGFNWERVRHTVQDMRILTYRSIFSYKYGLTCLSFTPKFLDANIQHPSYGETTKILYGQPGAYEPLKECATAMYTRVPLKYKFEPATVSVLGKYTSISDVHDA